MKFNYWRLIALICMTICALSATAQSDNQSTSDAKKDKDAHFLGKLPPSELQTIQGLGRSVLAAQQSATPDPTQESLRNDLKAMRTALDQALAMIVKTPPQLHGQGRTLRAIPSATAQTLRADPANLEIQVNISPEGQLTQQAAPPSPETNLSAEAPTPRVAAPTLRPPHGSRQIASGTDHLDAVRGMLATAKQRAAAMTAGLQPTDAVQKSHNLRLLSKSKELHQELEAMMNAATTAKTDDVAKLAQLRARLHPKNLREMFAEREAGKSISEPTPTLSTLTRHR